MYQTRLRSHFARLDQRELAVCLLLNQGCRSQAIGRFFSLISRLGDGVFWYVLIATLPLIFGPTAWHAVLHMIMVGLVNIVVYKLLKSQLLRARPFSVHSGIRLGAAPLDQYSFPSRHTLHAVAFTILCVYYYPELGWPIVSFAVLLEASRVVLGLHCPTDVLAGAGLGVFIAYVSLCL